MPICTEQWRPDIGQFYSLTHPVRVINILRRGFSKIQNVFSFFFNLFCCLLLRQNGDIEVNPAPKKKAAAEHFSCCHWNVNSLAAHDYQKVSILEAYNAIHHYDLVCVSETYLYSSILNDEKDILVKGYSLVRADHPSNTKRGGACIYYKESLCVRIIYIPNLTESILCQVTINNKTGYVLVVYRSPSQSSNDFEYFMSSFDQVITVMSV